MASGVLTRTDLAKKHCNEVRVRVFNDYKTPQILVIREGFLKLPMDLELNLVLLKRIKVFSENTLPAKVTPENPRSTPYLEVHSKTFGCRQYNKAQIPTAIWDQLMSYELLQMVLREMP